MLVFFIWLFYYKFCFLNCWHTLFRFKLFGQYFFERFLYFLSSSNFFLGLVDVVFDYNHLHSLFFWEIFVIPYCAPVLVIVLIRGIMLVSWRFLFMLLFPFWSHSLSYLVSCSISRWVSKQTAHNRMPII